MSTQSNQQFNELQMKQTNQSKTVPSKSHSHSHLRVPSQPNSLNSIVYYQNDHFILHEPHLQSYKLNEMRHIIFFFCCNDSFGSYLLAAKCWLNNNRIELFQHIQ